MNQYNIQILICLIFIQRIQEWWSQKNDIRMEVIQVNEVLNIQNSNYQMMKKAQMNMILFYVKGEWNSYLFMSIPSFTNAKIWLQK